MTFKIWVRIFILATILIFIPSIANAEVSINKYDLSGKIIVIDPGQLSTERDRVASGEYDITHNVGPLLKELLEKDGATVYLTDIKGDADEPGIGTRASFAISKKPDLIISIHTNGGVSTAKGVEVWKWGANDKPGFREGELADLVYKNVITQTQQPSTRGIKERNNPWDGTPPNNHVGVPILQYAYPCPAVLVELDFTTYSSPVNFNGKQYSNMRELMLSPEYQNSAAEALHSAICDHFYQKLDLIFLVDTTGSMSDDIANVKTSASEIVEALNSKGLDYRVCVADYRDYPMYPYGVPGTDYDYHLDLSFSSKDNKDKIIESINGLSLGNGYDWQESVYSALVKAMNDKNKDMSRQENLGWRTGATKCIILMGDAPPHDPEPWSGGHSLDDVISLSKAIDPVAVYSIRIGSDSTTYSTFSKISESTGGKVYTADNAEGLVDTIIEVIKDIKPTEPERGVSVDVNPPINVSGPGESLTYSINVTNTGTIADTYNVSIDLQNFASEYRGYPTAIQKSWINSDIAPVEIEPGATKTMSLTISIPNDWAGMEDVVYPFDVITKSETDESISNTSSAELKITANKKSMVEYSKLETIWLSELIKSSSIDNGIKNSLLAKLTNAELKLDQSISNIESGKDKQANNMLDASQNIINAFINQVEAQYDKKIMQPDAEMLVQKANTILKDINTSKN